MTDNDIEVWGHLTFRPFRIYWALEEFNLSYNSHRIGSRTGETQTPQYLKMNPKGKIPLFRHKDIYISESAAAMNYVVNNFAQPNNFYLPNNPKDKSKIDEWSYCCAMELDALGVYIMRRHQTEDKFGLANIYGEAPNAVESAKSHVKRMLDAVERDVPDENWLIGKNPSCADIMFMSCLQVIKLYKIAIKSKKIQSYFERSSEREQYKNAMIKTYGHPTLEGFLNNRS